MTFESCTRQIFFNGDISKNDKNLIDFYKEAQHLSLDPPPKGWTIYPPLSALKQEGPDERFIFRFKKHPYVSFKFREGELIITKLKNDSFSSPALKFIFDNREQADIAYNEFVGLYDNISTRKRFETSGSSRTAEFTDDKAKLISQVGFLEGKGDVLSHGYVIVFSLGNDLDNK